jgi:hypothetical protein
MHNINWQGNSHDDVNALNQAFGANKGDIKQKSLETIRLLRQAESALDEICNCVDDCTAFV